MILMSEKVQATVEAKKPKPAPETFAAIDIASLESKGCVVYKVNSLILPKHEYIKFNSTFKKNIVAWNTIILFGEEVDQTFVSSTDGQTYPMREYEVLEFLDPFKIYVEEVILNRMHLMPKLHLNHSSSISHGTSVKSGTCFALLQELLVDTTQNISIGKMSLTSQVNHSTAPQD